MEQLAYCENDTAQLEGAESQIGELMDQIYDEYDMNSNSQVEFQKLVRGNSYSSSLASEVKKVERH